MEPCQCHKRSVLAAAIMMEIPFVMIVLSRVLKYGANRWANIIAGIFHTALVAMVVDRGSTATFLCMFCSA